MRVVRRGGDVVPDHGFWTRAARRRRRNFDRHGSLHIADSTFEVPDPGFEPLQGNEPHVLINTES